MQLSEGGSQSASAALYVRETRNRTFALAKEPKEQGTPGGSVARRRYTAEMYNREGHKHVPGSCVDGVPANAIVIVCRGLRHSEQHKFIMSSAVRTLAKKKIKNKTENNSHELFLIKYIF